MHQSTRILRSLLSPPTPGTPLSPGPVFAAPFHLPGAVADAPFTYAGYEQPTWSALEHTLAVIETGDHLPDGLPDSREVRALCFASGSAALTAVLATTLRPGDAVILPLGGYFNTRRLAESFFAERGIGVRHVPISTSANELPDDLLAGARLLWLETPSNPLLEVADIAALSARAHAAGLLVAADNTTATPLGQNTLALGADLSVVSDTKLMTGHGDLLLGHVAVTDPDLYQRLLTWRSLSGSGPGPMESWLAHRSLATLPLRLERANANALGIATFLATRPEVLSVLYPGLPTHESHLTAARQMSHGFGPLLSFTLPSAAAAEAFLAASRLITNATSFGHITTTAERRARWGHDAIPEGLIRLSAGLEALPDLLADLDHALTASAHL